MSNTNTPFGFRHIGWGRGGPAMTGGEVTRKIAAGYSTAIYKGDLVQSISTGYITVVSGTGVAGSLIAGVFVGCYYLSTAKSQITYSSYWPTGDHAVDGTAIIIPIQGVPPQLFLAQASSTNFTLADVGNNFDVNVGTAGTITGGYGSSGMAIDHSTAGSTSTLPFQCVGLYSDIAPSGTNGTDNTNNFNIVLLQSNPFGQTGV